ncbi:MAG: DUF4136 domain-containing protein [Novosphingobium sp.]|uniref:DUF4136 domain-containing protein n=1 Tax=Novosphingobium sp. TaxID=1874826 RepID=UPI0032BBD7FE
MSQVRFTPLGLIKAGLASLMLAALAACATPFNANVQRYSQALPAPQGQTFAIVAEDQALAGGLEFSQYAGLVAGKLQALGYVPAADPATADMIVRFDYGVDKGREKVRQSAHVDPFWQPWYGYGRRSYWGSRRGYYNPYRPMGAWGYGYYDPWFDGGYESYTVYISGISMKIDRRADGTRLFEGRAEAASTSNRLPYLVPNLVEALFTDFPGRSGETVRISVAPEKKKR